MKVLLVGMAKLRYMPYINFYLQAIKEKNYEIHIINWDRDGEKDIDFDPSVHIHTFREDMMDHWSLKVKIPKLMRFRKYALSVINRVLPDFLIIHYSTTGVLLYDELIRRYKNRYILDYRDITYERNYVFRQTVSRIVRKSAVSFTSSDGFRKFLPDYEHLYTSHNVNMKLEFAERSPFRCQSAKHSPIRISFWGLIRSYNTNVKLINALKNDSRFELHYYGRVQGKMKELLENGCSESNNIFFHGTYLPDDTKRFAASTDLLHNMYDSDSKTEHIAMGNKYYDGINYCIPQVCTEGSYMANLAEKNGVGIGLNIEDPCFPDKLYDYYMKLDPVMFSNNCDKEAERINNEIKNGKSVILNAVESSEKQNK